MIRPLLLLACALFIFSSLATAQTKVSDTTAAATEKPKRPPIFRPTKDQINQVQKMLTGKGLYSGEVTGKLNDDTRTGIKNVQKTAGIRETGTLNRVTLEKMGIALTDQQKTMPVTERSLTPADVIAEKPQTQKKIPDTGAGSLPTITDPSPVPGDKPKKIIFRASADQVKAAQKMLNSRSMYSGEETGKLDDDTRDGLKKFQEASGIKVTGTLNAATLDKMGIPLTDKQKADAAAMLKN